MSALYNVTSSLTNESNMKKLNTTRPYWCIKCYYTHQNHCQNFRANGQDEAEDHHHAPNFEALVSSLNPCHCVALQCQGNSGRNILVQCQLIIMSLYIVYLGNMYNTLVQENTGLLPVKYENVRRNTLPIYEKV